MLDNKIIEPMSFYAQGKTSKLHSVAKTRKLIKKRFTTFIKYRNDSVKRQPPITHINKQLRKKAQKFWLSTKQSTSKARLIIRNHCKKT